MVLVCYTSSCHDDHLCQLFSIPTMHNKVMGQIRTGFTEVYAQCLSADCDLDLWPGDMVLVCYTLSCHDDHLCQIIFKFHHAWLSYGPDTTLEYTNTHTHTHMDRVNSICPSAISWRGHKNLVYTLEGTVSIKSSWNFVRMLILIKYKSILKLGHVGLKNRSQLGH